MVNVIMHGKGHLCIRSVNRTAGCVHEVLDLVMATSFENVYEADEITFDIGMRVGQ